MIPRFFPAIMAFQSTLPQGERLYGFYLHGKLIFISIHAPARGATQSLVLPVTVDCNFNPRSRKGSDITHPLMLLI